ncbi:glycoside hydrolase 3 [Zalerion maritima]|uniref:Beta-glucosidase cel3A n=1 Tax=Zalerion maritima TaxID=339359 RepID=A0AAD5RZE5_9PEZI|nr:glycoside hydrolase 3 [Zalerion maritima]
MQLSKKTAALLAFLPTVKAVQSAWQQCGGIGWTGETDCVDGYYCYEQNDYYFQCIPGSAAETTTTAAPTTTSTSSSVDSGSSTTSSSSSEETGSSGSSAWDDAYGKANTALSQLSVSEKVGIVSGIGWGNGPCVGNTSPVSSIGYPSLCLQDGPLGVRYASSITAFTPGVQAASTWDRDLIRQRGQYMAEEARGVGVHVLLGPVAGALGKTPQGGRNWEGFGVDPYLAGICMKETIEAMQTVGIQATAKHYLLNEQELNRETMSSNPDDRTLHELYLWPFIDAVHADVASVMCSYNKIDGAWACESEELMTTILKEELGFKGYVMSDWNAQHTGQNSANAGLDMTMPGSDFNNNNVLWGNQLVNMVNSGQVSEVRLDDMTRRILAAWYLTGQDSSFPSLNLNANVQASHADNVRAIAADGTVLLQNDGILPLSSPGKVAVIGSAAVENPNGINSCSDKGCNQGALGMGWGSGAVDYPYLVAPYDAINTRGQQDGTEVVLSASDSTSGVSVAQGADVAVVVITSDSGEGYIGVDNAINGDKDHLNPWYNGNELVQAVANVCDNVVVVVHSTGPIIMETIVGIENVRAIVWGGLASQENGNALVDILYGDVNPSGKLPYTIAKTAADFGAAPVSGDDNFSEGLYIDYRHLDKEGIEPRFEFGFGLSYSSYSYSDLTVDSSATAGAATGAIVPGGHEDLFEDVATVTATVSNTGSVAGKEVAQLYLSYPDSAPETPPKQLRGFEKIELEAGASGTVTFNLRMRDLSYWDSDQKNWIVPPGDFTVAVGASSRNLPLEGTITVS